MANSPRTIPLDAGVLGKLVKQIKLIGRLMLDRRVNPLIKLLPVGALIYWIVPTDLMPGLPFDDAAVLWLSSVLFIEFCPKAVVQEHLRALEAPAAEPAGPAQPDYIDADFYDAGPRA